MNKTYLFSIFFLVAVFTGTIGRAHPNDALFKAIENGNIAEMTSAIKSGASVNAVSSSGDTPLVAAVKALLDTTEYAYDPRTQREHNFALGSLVGIPAMIAVMVMAGKESLYSILGAPLVLGMCVVGAHKIQAYRYAKLEKSVPDRLGIVIALVNNPLTDFEYVHTTSKKNIYQIIHDVLNPEEWGYIQNVYPSFYGVTVGGEGYLYQIKTYEEKICPLFRQIKEALELRK